MEALLSWAKCQAYLAVGVDTGSENCGSSIIVCSLFSWYTLQNSVCYEESFAKKHILYNRLLYKDVARFWNSSVHELNKVDSPRHKISMHLDCEQSLSFPSVFLAFLSAIKQRAASGEAARSAGAEEKERLFFLPPPIPFPFLFLICIISTEFRAWSISGTKTDYS